MPRFAVPSTLAGLLAGVLLLPLAPPAGATATGTPFGAATTPVTSGLAFGDFTYPLATGKRVTVERHVLDPGEIVRWTGEGTTVAINQSGPLQHFPSCRSTQLWRAFPAYYTVRSKQHGTAQGVTANFGDVPVELVTITSEVIGAPQSSGQLHRHSGDEISGVGDLGESGEAGGGAVVDPVVPADGCPAGALGETSTVAAGVLAGPAPHVDLVDHNQIALYRHTVPAGYNSGFFSPFDVTLALPLAGEFTTQHECGDGTVRRPGEVFALDDHVLVRSTGAAEYLTIAWNIPNGFPVDRPFYVPELPPTDCPDVVLR